MPIFLRLCKWGEIIKFKTFQDVEEVYGKENLVKIVNLKQILFYCKNGLQPVFIDEGYQGKLVAWFHKPSTSMVWKYWKDNNPKNKINTEA